MVVLLLPQGVGAPACATILTSWFAAAERGTYWGMWNIAHNLGGFLAPVIVGELCSKRLVLLKRAVAAT
jgi:sugar phosphate permease